jgi:hypothetical protein
MFKMWNAQLTERQRQKVRDDCQIAVLLIGLCLLFYISIFTGLSDYLWHSYVESSCFVLNSTVIERAWCTQNQCTPKSDAVWHLNVHSKQLNFTEYLADIRQDFNVYYEAYEYILTHHLVCINSYQHFHVHFFLGWYSRTLLCAFKQ